MKYNILQICLKIVGCRWFYQEIKEEGKGKET